MKEGLNIIEIPHEQATAEATTKLAAATQQEIAAIPAADIRGILGIVVISDPSTEGGLMTRLIGYNGTDQRVHIESMLYALNNAVKEIIKEQGATLNAQASVSNH